MAATEDRVKTLIILSVVTAIAGLTCSGRWRAASKQDQVGRWPACQGVVTRSEVRWYSRGKGGKYYAVWVQYRFAGNGADRLGEVDSFQPEEYASDASAREAIALKYPPGREVRVFVNPANAAETAIDASPGRWGWVWFWGVVAVGAGAGLIASAWPVVMARRERRSSGPPVIETYRPWR